MEDPRKPANLQEFGQRLADARRRRDGERAPRRSAVSSQGMGAGFRIAVEMLAALVVGTGLGVLLDQWLGTSPWLLIVGFFLGSAAAFRNVVRTAKELDAARRRQREREAAERESRQPPAGP
mgnify:CR=1 FL=1